MRPHDDLNLYAYVGNDPTDKTDPSGLDSVGKMIDAAAEGCSSISCAGWATLNAAWQVFGAEGVSLVADKGWSGTSTANRESAGLEVMAALPPVKLVGEVAEGAKDLGGAYRDIKGVAAMRRTICRQHR